MNHPYRPENPINFPKTSDEKNLDLLGLLHYIAAGFIALLSCVFIVHIALGLAMTEDLQRTIPGLAVPGLPRQPLAGTIFVAMGAIAMVLGWMTAGLLLFAGRCIRQRKGHLFCMIVAALSCLSVPLGTLLGVFTLVLLTKPHIRLLFERAAETVSEPPPPLVRPWLLAVAGVVALGALSVFAVSRIETRVKAKSVGTSSNTSGNSPSDTPEARLRAAFLVAPGPLPTGLPMIGSEGVDADGYPTHYVDRAALRSLLHAHKFSDLDRYIEQLQTAFEADPRKEYWPIDAGEAFASAEPELSTDLDIWVAASADSFAAHFARGSHWVAVMWATRGSKYWVDTPEADRSAMQDAGRRALADLDVALTRRPRLVAAMRQEVRVAAATSDSPRRDEMSARAMRICPGCLQPRATHLWTLTPRWGGSYEAIRSFVATSIPLSANPRFRVLSGYEYLVRAETLEHDGKNGEALAVIESATKTGEYWEYRLERASILRRLGRLDEALTDLEQAAKQRPMHPAILSDRSDVQNRRQQYLPAGRDLLDTLRVDPANEEAKNDLPYVLKGVLWQAQKLEADHDHAAALDAADLGVALGPTDREAHRVHASIVLGDATTARRIAELQTYAAAHPGDFRTVQQLDYALSRQNRFPEIAVLWDAYLALHPNDGLGYMERSGTNHHLGKVVAARADAARACELGISEGCERAAAP